MGPIGGWGLLQPVAVAAQQAAARRGASSGFASLLLLPVQACRLMICFPPGRTAVLCPLLDQKCETWTSQTAKAEVAQGAGCRAQLTTAAQRFVTDGATSQMPGGCDTG